MFRVRRQFVFEALRWLKDHNPKYYGAIEINPVRIQQLPEDDVPTELLGVVRQSTDIGIIDQESDSYVPVNDGEQNLHLIDARVVLSLLLDGSNSGVTASANGCQSNDGEFQNFAGCYDTEIISETGPDMIPLQISGTVDNDLSKLTAREMMQWGLANLWRDGEEGGYAVRHGRQPVNDFGKQPPEDGDRPNFFEKAYPCLFPYGVGGLEADRPVEVAFGDHVKWALKHYDRRFGKHDTFPFVAFGILQRRQALHSAHVQMRRKTFDADARLLSTITVEKLKLVQTKEEKGIPISDPAVHLLRKHIHATGGRVMASDQARYQLRSQIWSTSIYINPPSLWITINPCDLHDPIAQVFCGEEIDLDTFIATAGPSKEKRAQNIAKDPYAAAKFFHFIIRAVLHTLFRITVTPYKVTSKMGVLGEVSAYFGTVESQGRGSLHLHMLLWLKGAPSSVEMHEKLQQAEFRAQVVVYIKANLRAYVPGLDSADAIKRITNEPQIAYSRPIDPNAPEYEVQIVDFERHLARGKQVHTCELQRCLVPNKHGHYQCKRRAPFACASEDSVDEGGQWKPKRLYAYMNGWNPAVLLNCRCNNDTKFLTNGSETWGSSFYITGYATKKQNKNHNMSAIMAKGYAYHIDHSKYLDDIRDHHQLLLFRLVHNINREQEISAPMVCSHLEGSGEKYCSHKYLLIYWSSFVGVLLKDHPELRCSPKRDDQGQTNLQ